MAEIVTDKELATLSDDELVRLIMERTSLDEARAREALTIIRDKIPDGTVFSRAAAGKPSGGR